ncbi:hypothetical protein DY000_02044078 [Brassica cretica]|uniref:HTH myb-type domain-containing protein n=1 Tax=Brassica cretica TaxID=69181 RepID=A0ABQ7BEM2_BRACR|nr:hypothetical protein DY000_02044078 [Brassica cretica]
MGRSPCCDKAGLKKGPWTPEEDQKLLAYIEEHGHGSSKDSLSLYCTAKISVKIANQSPKTNYYASR